MVPPGVFMISKKKNFIVLIAIVIILLIVLLAKVFNVKTLILKQIYPKKYSEYVEKYAKEYDVDPLLIFSIIKVESNFDEKAKSSSGAKGLMQLMEATATEIANKIDEPLVEQESLLEPEKNIMIGTKYYSELLEMYDENMLLALTAYNAGIGNVNGWIESGIIKKDGSDIENIPYKETNMYVRKIINNYKIYQSIY
ncbi:MAG: lytic transglycosylase domain-containing protein [Clostridia bacterium]